MKINAFIFIKLYTTFIFYIAQKIVNWKIKTKIFFGGNNI